MKEYKRFLQAAVIAVVLMTGATLATGCSIERTDPVKVEDLEYTILEESQIPQELAVLIQEKKTQRFQLTFDTDSCRYIVVGYGTQPTGGYSICVEELYLSTNAIYVNTNLIGPLKGENVSKAATCPYIVIQIDYFDKSVVFE